MDRKVGIASLRVGPTKCVCGEGVCLGGIHLLLLPPPPLRVVSQNSVISQNRLVSHKTGCPLRIGYTVHVLFFLNDGNLEKSTISLLIRSR